jgi:hypothetical protein
MLREILEFVPPFNCRADRCKELLVELEKSLEIPVEKLSYSPTTKRVVIRKPRAKEEVCAVLARLGF